MKEVNTNERHMNYRNLYVEKKFPRMINYDVEKQHDFLYHINENRNKIPAYNPLKDVIFEASQGPFDIYKASRILHVTGGYLISDRLKNILLEYGLSEHVIYENMRYKIKGKDRDDLNLIFFYMDYSTLCDLKRSEFILVTKEKGLSWMVKPYDEIGEYIIETNINFNSYEDYYKKQNDIKDNAMYVVKYLCCPEAMKYDVFCFIDHFASGCYISRLLRERFAKEKIRGIDYWNGTRYDFKCVS